MAEVLREWAEMDRMNPYEEPRFLIRAEMSGGEIRRFRFDYVLDDSGAVEIRHVEGVDVLAEMEGRGKG